MGIRYGDLFQLEQKHIDAVVRELALGLAHQLLESVEVRRRRQRSVDVPKLLAVILEIVVGIGIDAYVEWFDVANDRQIEILVGS